MHRLIKRNQNPANQLGKTVTAAPLFPDWRDSRFFYRGTHLQHSLLCLQSVGRPTCFVSIIFIDTLKTSFLINLDNYKFSVSRFIHLSAVSHWLAREDLCSHGKSGKIVCANQSLFTLHVMANPGLHPRKKEEINIHKDERGGG